VATSDAGGGSVRGLLATPGGGGSATELLATMAAGPDVGGTAVRVETSSMLVAGSGNMETSTCDPPASAMSAALGGGATIAEAAPNDMHLPDARSAANGSGTARDPAPPLASAHGFAPVLGS